MLSLTTPESGVEEDDLSLIGDEKKEVDDEGLDGINDDAKEEDSNTNNNGVADE